MRATPRGAACQEQALGPSHAPAMLFTTPVSDQRHTPTPSRRRSMHVKRKHTWQAPLTQARTQHTHHALFGRRCTTHNQPYRLLETVPPQLRSCYRTAGPPSCAYIAAAPYVRPIASAELLLGRLRKAAATPGCVAPLVRCIPGPAPVVPHWPARRGRVTRRPLPSSTIYNTPASRHLAVNFSADMTGLRSHSHDSGTPKLTRMSPWVRAQSCRICCCSTAKNLPTTWALLYGFPLLSHRTVQTDSSMSSRRCVQRCCSSAGGCQTPTSSSSTTLTSLQSTPAPGCTLSQTPSSHCHAPRTLGHPTKRCDSDSS